MCGYRFYVIFFFLLLYKPVDTKCLLKHNNGLVKDVPISYILSSFTMNLDDCERQCDIEVIL